jgi:hemerythrin-like metal-binding protein
MAMFAWDNIYSVGHEQIDAQHRRLFDIANRFHDAFVAMHGPAVLSEVFGELVDYTVTHFTDEERLLQTVGYPDIAAHRRHHEKLVELVQTYRRQLEAGENGIERRIMEFLKAWLNGHILGTDRNYKEFVAA